MAGINHVAVKASGDKGLASEWNADHEQKGNHDCAKFQHENHVIENRTDFPAGPVEGQVVMRTDEHKFYVWNGTTWITFIAPATIVVAADGSGHYTDVQDGIDALPAGGGAVYIKEGVYTISTRININQNNTLLQGAGPATLIQRTDSGEILRAFSKDKIIIKNIRFKSTGVYTNTHYGLHFDDCDDGFVIDCLIDDTNDESIRIKSGKRFTARGNIVDGSGGAGIFVQGAEYGHIIVNNTVQFVGGIGIDVFGASTIVQGNQVTYNDYSGIRARDVGKNTITGNHVYGNNQTNDANSAGILIDGFSDDNNISSNTVHENDVAQIWIKDVNCNRNVVISNMTTSTIHPGIVDNGTNTLPNGAVGTTNLQLDDLNYV